MAAVATAVTGVKRNTAGSRTQVTRRISFTGTYTTGGDSVVAGKGGFGLHRVIRAYNGCIISGFAAGFAHADVLPQTNGSVKIRLRAADGTEVANATDHTTVVVDVTVEGQ